MRVYVYVCLCVCMFVCVRVCVITPSLCAHAATAAPFPPESVHAARTDDVLSDSDTGVCLFAWLCEGMYACPYVSVRVRACTCDGSMLLAPCSQ